MKFIQLHTIDDGATPLADRIIKELTDGKKVLWMVSGGSNISLAVTAMEHIPDDLTDHLSVCLVDERYGEVGHADSNGQQLEAAGFDPKNARVRYVLAPSLSLQETAEQFSLALKTDADAADIVIAQLGMGPDGHVLGILPGSPAVDSKNLVESYVADDYQRITPTVKGALEIIDVAYVFAFGANKHAQLETLRDTDTPVSVQPAQLLKQLHEAYVYNDHIAS